ncbi:hypothetical protein K7432_010116 [Basidiobolus ranarum]|uniref:Major royal jelly protein n=1 Tax=Basidiobolus ranarum TaxID=34480 RepID=A0ABR2VWS5_9FUNG
MQLKIFITALLPILVLGQKESQLASSINANSEAPLNTTATSVQASLPSGDLGRGGFRGYPLRKFYKQFPVGVAVSKGGRTFVSFPRWEQNKGNHIVELVNNREVAYPNKDMNDLTNPDAFNQIHTIVIDGYDRLWCLDTRKPTNGARPQSQHRFYVIDIKTNKIVRTYTFPPGVELPNSVMQDIRFDAKMKYGFITDTNEAGIVVLDLETGQSWRRLANHYSTLPMKSFVLTIEGVPLYPGGKHFAAASNGIAISADFETVYYAPLSSRSLYSVPVKSLIDTNMTDAQVGALVQTPLPDKGSATSGLATDSKGCIYLANLERNSITRYDPKTNKLELVARDPNLLWPDTLAISNGYLYATANQLHRRASFQNGPDARKAPYYLFQYAINEDAPKYLL